MTPFDQHRLVQLISNQTQVSTTLATHLSNHHHASNFVFSPLSIQAVLGVLAAGSEGQTLDQLLSFLKADTTDDLNSLYSQLVSSTLADGSPTRLSFANAVWIHKDFSLKPCFKQVAETLYKAACKQVDFQKAVEVAGEVNSWAKEQTNGLINQIITDKDVKQGTMLIVGNAIYFKGTWSQKFNKSWTEERDFHLLNGNRVKVPFMTSHNDQFVREYEDFKVLGLPYSQGQDRHRKFTMYIYLSDAKDGLPSLIEKIGSTSGFLDRYIPRQKVKVGKFFMPKFKIEFGFEASGMLKDLGLQLPFGFGHRFTEMVESPLGEGVYVSRMYHKAVVEVNEEGTEAAAVTVAFGMFGGAPQMTRDPVDFVADHPFLFVIREDVTGVVLFMGQVTDPR